jgi:hypothetical protein
MICGGRTPNSMGFEHWLRFTVPRQLNLSPSKQVAMEKKFDHFADLVRPLEKKAPAEFERFFKALQTKIQEVNTWRAPRGTRVAPSVTDGKIETYDNGKLIYHLIETGKKKPTIIR